MTTQEYIKQHRNDDVYRLALSKAPEGVDIQYALQQISAYQILTKKVPSWAECDDLIFPKKLSLEQSSSELTARYKAELILQYMGNNPFSHIDFTGGMGIDCYFIAQHTLQSYYVEQNSELCQIAKHNFSHLNTNISVLNTTAEEFLNQITDNASLLTLNSSLLIYLDPARRGDHGQKLVSIADCQPNVIELLPQMFSITNKIVIKLSPMLDITRALNELSNIEHLYVISVGNECKELLLFINREYNNATQIHAINLKPTVKNQHSIADKYSLLNGTLQEEYSLTLHYASEIKQYLYEPYAAHLKSGLYKTLAQRYNVEKLHQHSHLYTSTELNPDFPGRQFRVEKVIPFDKKTAKLLFKNLKQANLTTRNFPLSVSELRTQYKIREGGDTYIFATTLHDESRILIICYKA